MVEYWCLFFVIVINSQYIYIYIYAYYNSMVVLSFTVSFCLIGTFVPYDNSNNNNNIMMSLVGVVLLFHRRSKKYVEEEAPNSKLPTSKKVHRLAIEHVCQKCDYLVRIRTRFSYFNLFIFKIIRI
jgi:hypothetical protein